MSELRTYDVIMTPSDDGSWVLKSEADKVIAELKNEIAPNQSDKTLQERLNEVCEKHGVSTLQDLDWAFCESEKRHTKDNIEAVKVIAHHKYKRCLAMAGRCRLRGRLLGACGLYEKELWALKWHKRWLELAEKLKEAR